MLEELKESHVNHVPEVVLKAILEYYKDAENPDGKTFIETCPIPAGITLECRLRGPAVGDPKITEDQVKYEVRKGREYVSRMVHMPPVPTNLLTVIMAPLAGHPLVLITCYPGPAAPQELNDPYLLEKDRAQAIAFWDEHALCDWPTD